MTATKTTVPDEIVQGMRRHREQVLCVMRSKFALKAGLTTDQLVEYERGRSRMRVATFARILAAWPELNKLYQVDGGTASKRTAPLWLDPRAELPDGDIAVRVIAHETTPSGIYGDLTEFDATYIGDAEWRDGCDQSYITAEIVVWRDLTESESESE